MNPYSIPPTNDYNVGDKVMVNQITPFWFTNMIENVKNLDKKKVYTVSTVTVASSWTGITLKETGDLKYNAYHFKVVDQP